MIGGIAICALIAFLLTLILFARKAQPESEFVVM